MNLTTLYETAIERKASDIHLATGEAPCLRIGGKLVRLEATKLDRASFHDLLEPVLTPENRARIAAGYPVDCTAIHDRFAFSVYAFRAADDDLAATIRVVATGVPSLDKIGIGGMRLFDRILEAARGLVIVAGPTGSGKTTAMFSVVEAINAARPARIFAIEDRASYRFESKQGLVTQLSVGSDPEGYLRALDIAHQADLDVVAVNDIPTAECLRRLLLLAETGHLVFANLHADSVSDAVERLLGVAPDDQALRRAIARHLFALSVQRLVPRSDTEGRIAAYEWIASTPAVREALLAGRPDRLADLQRTDPECRSLDAALDDLVASGHISAENASKARG